MSVKCIIMFLCLCCLASCATTTEKPASQKQSSNVGGTAVILSAYAVATTLMPFVSVYHALNGTEEKLQARQDSLNQQFDPLYEERIRQIQERDVVKDVSLLVKQGNIAYFPCGNTCRTYPGFEGTLQPVSDHVGNAELIQKIEFLTFLSQLLSMDQQHEAVITEYYGDAYRQFNKVSWDYRKRFNLEMYQQALLRKQP